MLSNCNIIQMFILKEKRKFKNRERIWKLLKFQQKLFWFIFQSISYLLPRNSFTFSFHYKDNKPLFLHAILNMIFQRPVLIQTFNTEQKWNICWKDPVRHNQNLLFRPSLTIPHGRGQYLLCLKFTVYKLKYLQRHERHHAWSGRAKAAKYWEHTHAMCMCVFVLQERWKLYWNPELLLQKHICLHNTNICIFLYKAKQFWTV